jgi:hypothetical protein
MLEICREEVSMPSDLVDLNAPAHNPATPKPRGLLPVPSEVGEILARERARLVTPMTDEEECRIRNDLTLQYYYEGTEVAYRMTPPGVEVLAVGWDEIRDYLRGTPPEGRKGVLIGQV